MDRIERSIEYGALDHKWLARDMLHKKAQGSGLDSDLDSYLYDIATSAFTYYQNHKHTLDSDISIKAITQLCSMNELETDIDAVDDQVFHLSHVFNEIIESTRAMHKCYDCGTNARAIFLKLIEAHRGTKYISHEEQQRMKDEYLVTRRHIRDKLQEAKMVLESSETDMVMIMSLAIQGFGHVWVIEKQHTPIRYHQYQSSFRSHLLLDFIEHMDYGKHPNQSLDLDQFFIDMEKLLCNLKAWTDDDYRLFAKLFAFLPITPIKEPKPGFSYTWVQY